MSAKTNKAFLLILVGLYIFLGMRFKPWTDIVGNNDFSDILLALSSLIALVGLIIGCLGLALDKKTNILCLIANGIYLIVGCYATYLFWTLWIFHEPTLAEKVQKTIPAALLGICVPVALFFYFAKIKKS